MIREREPHGAAESPLEADALTERQWDALGALRRLQDGGPIAASGSLAPHLAAIRTLEALGLADVTEFEEPGRGAGAWTARLTEAGRRASDNTPLTPPFRD